jgi:hypothetical protein
MTYEVCAVCGTGKRSESACVVCFPAPPLDFSKLVDDAKEIGMFGKPAYLRGYDEYDLPPPTPKFDESRYLAARVKAGMTEAQAFHTKEMGLRPTRKLKLND